MRIDRAGTFQAWPTSHEVTETGAPNCFPRFEVQFTIVGEYDFEALEYLDVSSEELETRGFFCLTGKDNRVLMGADQVHDAFGWGGGIPELRDADYSKTPVVLVIKISDFNQKLQVDSLHNAEVDPTNIGGIKALAPERLAKIEYQSNFLQIIGILAVCVILIYRGYWYIIFAFIFSVGISYSHGIASFKKYKMIMQLHGTIYDPKTDKSPTRRRSHVIKTVFGRIPY